MPNYEMIPVEPDTKEEAKRLKHGNSTWDTFIGQLLHEHKVNNNKNV